MEQVRNSNRTAKKLKFEVLLNKKDKIYYFYESW